MTIKIGLKGSMINQIHLQKCDSTQTYLKQLLEQENEHDSSFLVSTEKQTQGIGRAGKSWLHFSNSLALSFNLPPAKVPTLTSLELGILVSEFIQNKFKTRLYLKWPNDLFLQNKLKVSGIIIQSSASDDLIAGIGINIGPIEVGKSFDYFQAGSIQTGLEVHKKELSKEICLFIHDNRINDSNQIRQRWLDFCIHKDKPVDILSEPHQKTQGIFKGIGESGEALIKTEQGIISIFSGSLIY